VSDTNKRVVVTNAKTVTQRKKENKKKERERERYKKESVPMSSPHLWA
jgi:hypothetical protein